MILILSNRRDATTDLLMPLLEAHAEVFRFNVDLWRDYSWSISATGYELRDPTGRTCRECEVGAVYDRKVMFDPPRIDVPAEGCPEAWLRNEVLLIWSGIKDLAVHSGKCALVHPSPHGTWYKMRQMRLSAEYFPVPAWQMLHRAPVQLAGEVVCKTNGVEPMGNGQILMVNKVDPARLDTAYPWFLQQCLSCATHDVTVVYVNGKLFAYEMPRGGSTDCRIDTFNNADTWTPCELTPEQSDSICRMMRRTGLSFSRMDFLRDADGTLHFLEFNVNGQYAWLDLHNERGLLTAIAHEILRVHAAHS